MRPWNFVLFIAIAMMPISSVAEGQTQNLEGGQGVKWVPDEGQVPENAIRVRVGAGFPLCRGTLTEERGGQNWWRDIGVVKQDGKCHTLRAMKELRFQDDFYYLVRADTEGEVSTEGMVSEADVEARIAEATAQLEAELQAAQDRTQGMVPESEVEAAVGEARAALEAEIEEKIAAATVGMVSEAELQETVYPVGADWRGGKLLTYAYVNEQWEKVFKEISYTLGYDHEDRDDQYAEVGSINYKNYKDRIAKELSRRQRCGERIGRGRTWVKDSGRTPSDCEGIDKSRLERRPPREAAKGCTEEINHDDRHLSYVDCRNGSGAVYIRFSGGHDARLPQ